jgi:hypothetical protein
MQAKPMFFREDVKLPVTTAVRVYRHEIVFVESRYQPEGAEDEWVVITPTVKETRYRVFRANARVRRGLRKAGVKCFPTLDALLAA